MSVNSVKHAYEQLVAEGELHTFNRFMMHAIVYEQGKTCIIGFANIDIDIDILPVDDTVFI